MGYMAQRSSRLTGSLPCGGSENLHLKAVREGSRTRHYRHNLPICPKELQASEADLIRSRIIRLNPSMHASRGGLAVTDFHVSLSLVKLSDMDYHHAEKTSEGFLGAETTFHDARLTRLIIMFLPCYRVCMSGRQVKLRCSAATVSIL